MSDNHENYTEIVVPGAKFNGRLVYDFVVDKPPELRWIVDKLLGSNDLVMVTADPMVGKSWLTSHLACCVSSGQKFLGRFDVCKDGMAVVVDEENHLYEAWRRFRRLVNGYGYKSGDVNGVRYYNRPGLNIDADPTRWERFWAHVASVFHQNRASVNGRLVVLDSLSRLHRTNENDAVAMAYLLERIKLYQSRLECALVFVHHSRKAAIDWRGRTVEHDPSQSARGSSDLRAVVDQHWYLRRVENGRFSFIHDKHRTGPTPVDPFDVKLVDSGNEATILECDALTPVKGQGGIWVRALPIVEAGVKAGDAPSKIHAACKAAGVELSYEYLRRIIKKVVGAA